MSGAVVGAIEERSELDTTATIETRYEIERTLGQGATGIVYQVRDRETGERLALKKLLRIEVKSVMRLKREFRALAALHHPNLVKLYDLGHTHDAWFITMEHLRGSDLRSYLGWECDPFSTVRRGSVANHNADPNDLHRLSRTFQQLARGIHALHRAGMLHRDLKPSNVMVVDERVVVLDFGLVREVGDSAVTVTYEDTIAGTPAYMAPEQVSNDALTGATDWYAFGVMLYEAISGRLPIDGKVMELLQNKLQRDPHPLSRLSPGTPPALNALCTALLQRTPTARPDYDAIMEVLETFAPALDYSSQAEVDAFPLGPARAQTPTRLVGRGRELESLERSLDLARLKHQLVVTHVHGPSGTGKSALVEHFLDIREQHAALDLGGRPLIALRARCHEREAMPFKALDGLVDSLVGHLVRMDEFVVCHMLPGHIAELTRAFPVLEQLPVVQRLLATRPPHGNAAVERVRAQHALHELLHRIATHHTLILWIDDLQWGDPDSVAILKGWFEQADTLPMLLILSYRSDEHDTNACLKLLEQPTELDGANIHRLEVTPLGAAEIELLCSETFGADAGEHASLIRHIAAEVHGSPFLAKQLLTVAHAAGDTESRAWQELSVHGLVTQLSSRLSDSERALLRNVAVAGRPVAVDVALNAAGIQRRGREHVHALQGLNLTRVRTAAGRRLIETYHDRIREVIVAALSESERIEAHQQLLAAFQLSDVTDPDWLHVVAKGAQEHEAARHYCRLAADRAVATLAFERAAELYTECLTQAHDRTEQLELWRQLGDALASSDRDSRAADAYRSAAELAPPEHKSELLQLAATHMVRCGRFAEGETLVKRVLDAQHIKLPSSVHGMLAAVGWERARMRLRGLDFEQHAQTEIAPEALQLVTTYGTLSVDTQAYDPLRAALFQSRALRLALDLGVPSMVSSALCISATMRCVSGSPRDERYASTLLDRAFELANQLDDPLVHARVSSARAVCAFLTGRTATSIDLSIEADRLYAMHTHSKNELPGEHYHRFMVRAARIGALFQLGRLTDASAELRAAVNDARLTENRTKLLHLTMVRSVDDLAHDRPEQARARLDEERTQLPASFGPLHLLHMVAVMRVACQLADYAWAEHVLADMWPRFEKSLVRQSVLALLAYGAHARLLLNRHIDEEEHGDPRAILAPDLWALQRSSHLAPSAYTRFQARLAWLEGRSKRAEAHYRAHIQGCINNGFQDELERGRWALGRVIGGEEGTDLCARALQNLAALGLTNPLAELRAHFPELHESTESSAEPRTR